MKTKKILLSGVLGIALAGVLLTGCKKDSTSNPTGSTDSDITSAQDDANATSTANDGKSVSDNAMQSNVGHRASSGPITLGSYGNAIVKLGSDSGVGAYDTLYIIFPNTPTYCSDYKYREGEIEVYWPKQSVGFLWQAYLDSNVQITESFKNYAVGLSAGSMNTISGTRTWTNEGQNQGGYENWNFTANLSLTYANGQTATWQSNRVNVLTNVGGTWYYSITGTAEGVNRLGADYSLTITSPLYITAQPWWNGGCAWIEAGSINVNRQGNNNTLTVNFGTVGTCDDKATATINGVQYPFTMW